MKTPGIEIIFNKGKSIVFVFDSKAKRDSVLKGIVEHKNELFLIGNIIVNTTDIHLVRTID